MDTSSKWNPKSMIRKLHYDFICLQQKLNFQSSYRSLPPLRKRLSRSEKCENLYLKYPITAELKRLKRCPLGIFSRDSFKLLLKGYRLAVYLSLKLVLNNFQTLERSIYNKKKKEFFSNEKKIYLLQVVIS